MNLSVNNIMPDTDPNEPPPWVMRSSWLMVQCPNCILYEWKQKDDGEVLFRCSGCKAVRYCSKECQREHWKKQHREQCNLMRPILDRKDPLLKQAHERGDWVFILNQFSQRLLAGNPAQSKKALESLMLMHNPLNCNTCRQVTNLGPRIKSITDPHLGCLLNDLGEFSCTIEIREVENSEDFTIIKLPYALGEQTGKFTSKYEQTLSLMQRVVHKMYLTSHPLVAQESTLRALFFHIGSLRTQLLHLTVQIPSGQILEYFHQDKIFHSNQSFFKLTELIVQMNHEQQDEITWDSPYKLWKTFQILLFYCLHPTHPDRVVFDELGERLEDESLNEALSKNETSEKFIIKRLAILESLQKGLIPFSDLLEILCEEDRHKVCGSCHAGIFIEDAVFPFAARPPSRPSILVVSGFSSFCCSKVSCFKTVWQSTRVLTTKLQTIYHHFALKFTPNRCDMCLKFSTKVHRCDRCLTKVYCSEECRVQDRKIVHKELCKKDSEVRKIKGGMKRRRKVGKVLMEDYVTDGLQECVELRINQPIFQLDENLKKVMLDTTEKLCQQLM